MHCSEPVCTHPQYLYILFPLAIRSMSDREKKNTEQEKIENCVFHMEFQTNGIMNDRVQLQQPVSVTQNISKVSKCKESRDSSSAVRLEKEIESVQESRTKCSSVIFKWPTQIPIRNRNEMMDFFFIIMYYFNWKFQFADKCAKYKSMP